MHGTTVKIEKQMCFIQFYCILVFLDHSYYVLQSEGEM